LTDLLRDLQAAVGDAYRLEEELGGGGMSRVFLAEEVRLGRKVVIKVLPPEMTAGVSIDRFEREIQVAAKLQHPHIVPLLTAGSHGDLLYYVMPFIEGQSLRAKLAREGELPIGEVARILRDVADALAYAHKQDVVHRDIKPDNVLLADGHALVTDFGIAKAVSDSTGGTSLTSMGVALGTPAYMSPEQAAANPHVDHRADIYSLGALAYEMLCGRPPFDGSNPQAVLAAHVTQAPEACTTHRASVPAALNELVMRCLAKLPADRFQTAEELKQQFELMATPSGGMTPTGTQPVKAVMAETRLRLNRPARVAVLYGTAAVAVLLVAYALMILLGLPGWVLPASAGLLAIGLPIVMLTSRAERRRATTQLTGAAPPGGTPLNHRLNWRSSVAGGGLAFGALGVAVTGYMLMRALGIGPVGTLIATGALTERDRLILADFENRTADSTLAETVTELTRIDLAQSPIISILEPSQVGIVLERMRRPRDTTLTPDLAREVAEREGIKAYITGEIAPVGEGFVLAARIISTETGEAIVSGRETADDASGLITAVDNLSAHLRERIGESLRSVRADEPLEAVTTSSIDALRMYAQSRRAGDRNDYERAITLLEEAIAADSLFAAAYRALGIYFANIGQAWRADTPLTRAYELRERLTEHERYLATAAYQTYVNDDRQSAIEAYQTLLEKYPDDPIASNNLAFTYSGIGRWAEAEAILQRQMETGPTVAVHYTNLFSAQGNQGKYDEASATLDRFEEAFPGNPLISNNRATVAASQWQYEEAEAQLRALREAQPGNPRWQSIVARRLRLLATVHGRLGEADRLLQEAVRFERERGMFEDPDIPDSLTVSEVSEFAVAGERLGQDAWFGVDPGLADRAVGFFESVRQFAEVAPIMGFAAELLAQIGELDRAKAYLEEQRAITERQIAAEDDPDAREGLRRSLRELDAKVAMYDGRADSAIAYYRDRRENPERTCILCWMWELGNAHDLAGNADSAVAWFERHLETRVLGRLDFDNQQYPHMLRRLGELHEAKGNTQQAVDYYSRFVDLWGDADAELQPIVEDIRGRLVGLVGEGGVSREE